MSTVILEPKNDYLLAEPFFFILFLLMFILIGIVRWNYTKNFSEILQSVVNLRLTREVLREEIILASRASQIVMIVAHLSVALFIYLMSKALGFEWFGVQLSGLLLYLSILALVLFLYVVKITVISFLKWLLAGDFSLTEYEFNYRLMLKVAGLALIPVNLLMAYTSVISVSYLWLIGLVILGASVLWRWVRGCSNALNLRISVMYIILYLCTLEILPIAVALKALTA